MLVCLAQTKGLPVVFTLYFNNDDSGTNAGPGTSRISVVGAGGTPEGTTSRRKLLQSRSRFTRNLIFNHDLFNCAIVGGCSVQSHSATSNTYACGQQVSPLCAPRSGFLYAFIPTYRRTLLLQQLCQLALPRSLKRAWHPGNMSVLNAMSC